MEGFLKTGKLSSNVTQNEELKKRVQVTIPIPWVEKYRPKTVKDVAHQDQVVSVLKKSLEGADLPNLLFYGPPGTGKTSTIIAASKDLFGDLYKERVLELNSSDERGINVIRNKIKSFAQTTASGFRKDGTTCPPYKIIILDEADSMTKDAQSALRRTMEKEGKSTKFCLICNYVSRIIEPLTSRCAKFRFKPLSNDVLIQRLRSIASSENVRIKNEDAYNTLISTSDGDLRKAITSLQSCAGFVSGAKGEVSKEVIQNVCGVVSDMWISGFLRIFKSNSFEKLDSYVDEFILEGYSGHQLLLQLYDAILTVDELTDAQRSIIYKALAISDYRLISGANEYLQVMDFCCVCMKVFKSLS